MGEPCSEEVCSVGRTRKRILDSLEIGEENIFRRPGCADEQHDTFVKGYSGIPNKRGFTGSNGRSKWESEDIDRGLAADFDDSLSGLGIDMNTASYNMSDAILALPPTSTSMFKPEALSPNSEKHIPSQCSVNFDEGSQATADRIFKLLTDDGSPSPATSVHQFFQHCSTTISSGFHENPVSLENNNNNDGLVFSSVGITSHEEGPHDFVPLPSSHSENNMFQYILGAATSISTKRNEETLSYLNQGQSYEIKIIKSGDLTCFKGRVYHSIIRICFHERRLQFMEREHLLTWQQMRPAERILEIDVPLSYGVSEVLQDPKNLNAVEFDWDPIKDVRVYIKVETYRYIESRLERIHVCGCQIKVFKLKGADRKHKQDREKIQKRPLSEQEKYQESCECTILTELSPENVYIPPEGNAIPSVLSRSSPITVTADVSLNNSDIKTSSETSDNEGPTTETDHSQYLRKVLASDAAISETQKWLIANRFSKFTTMFADFCGADLLKLSRCELKEICGIADGIRLFNVLHGRNVIPRLTLYVCLEHDQVYKIYNAVYLENGTYSEFIRKIACLMNVTLDKIHDVHLQCSGIHIIVNDDVIRNFPDESTLSVQVLQDSCGEKYRLLLHTTSKENLTR